jgi:hypothetical protein
LKIPFFFYLSHLSQDEKLAGSGFANINNSKSLVDKALQATTKGILFFTGFSLNS